MEVQGKGEVGGVWHEYRFLVVMVSIDCRDILPCGSLELVGLLRSSIVINIVRYSQCLPSDYGSS